MSLSMGFRETDHLDLVLMQGLRGPTVSVGCKYGVSFCECEAFLGETMRRTLVGAGFDSDTFHELANRGGNSD